MKKILSLILSLVLVAGIIPQISVCAATVEDKLKTDYTPEEMPINLFDGPYMDAFYSSPNFNHNIKLEGETAVAMDVEGKLNAEGHLYLQANRDLADPHIQYSVNSTTGYHEWDGVSMNYNWPLSGVTTKSDNLKWHADDGSYSYDRGNVVFSFEVYNDTPEESISNDAKINIGRVYLHRSSTKDETEYPVEYNGKTEGLLVTVSREEGRQYLSGTFKDMGTYDLDQYIYCLGLAQGTPKDTMLMVDYDNIYFGIEEAYDIKTEVIGTNVIAPGIGGEIKVDADILNQIGKKGALEQGDFIWHVLNDDRTEYAEGFTVEVGADGNATITVSPSAAEGTYTVVAESENYPELVRGTKIHITHKDYEPAEMPKNYLADDTLASDLFYMNFNKHIKLDSESGVNVDVYVEDKDDGNVTLTARRDLTDPNEVYEDTDGDGYSDTLVEGATNISWGFSGAAMERKLCNLPSEKGSVVYSFKVTNNNPDIDAKVNLARNTSPIYSAEYSKDSGMDVLASGGRWQTFCGTIPNDGTSNMNAYSYTLGMPAGTKKGASVTIKADDIYLGVEEAYDIENNVIGENTVTVGVGGRISVDADIVNQIYSTGGLDQGEFSWRALNAERTQEIDGITITPGENGTAAVSISPDVPAGAYDIVASSKKYDGFIKGARIYVILPEDAEADGMSQHIARDFEELSILTFLLNGIKHTNSDVYYESSSGPLGDSKVLTVEPTSAGGMALFDIRTEAGNKYKISAWVRADSYAENGYFVFTNGAQDGGSDVVNEVPVNRTEGFAAGEWVYVTAEYSANGRGMREGTLTGAMLSGTVGFRFGSDSTVSYAMDDLFVMPVVDNKLDHNDVFTEGSFDSSSCLDYWTVWANEGGELTEEQQITNGYSYDGNKNKPGALELDCIRTYDAIRPKGDISIEYGTEYSFSFDAKAIDDEATGQPIWFYISFGDKAGDGYDPVFNQAYHLNDSQNPPLAKKWQHYEIIFDYDFVARNLAEITNVGFRVSDTYNIFVMNGGRPHYMIDNVSLKQIGGTNFVIDMNTYGNVHSEEGAAIKFDYTESTKGNIFYKIVRETAQGEYCLKADVMDEEVINFSYMEDLGEDKLRIDAVATDAYGKYSQIYTSYLKTQEPVSEITLKTDEFFWNDNTETLNATLVCEDNTGLSGMDIYAALYTSDGKLAFIDKAEHTPVEDSVTETSVSVSAEYLQSEINPAVSAKFFVWYKDSMAPVTVAGEVTKSLGEYIYVDVESTSSEENGTISAPFKTLSSALAYLESIIKTTEEENIYVVLKSGEYVQTEALDLSGVAGNSDKNITFTTLDGEKASITGARRITDFTLYENGIYRAQVPEGTNSRQLYVDGIKAVRARSVLDIGGFTNSDLDNGENFANEGLLCTDTSYAGYKYKDELELVFFQNWCHYYIMPDTITEVDGKSHFGFVSGANGEVWERLMTDRTIPAKVPAYVENALELLDEPGEWYLDTHENYLYYMPRSFEDISTAEVIMPVAEQLIVAEGTADVPVENLQFKNIDFKYTTWNYPTTNRSFLPNQALYYENERQAKDGDEIIEGALQFKNVRNIIFDNCDFAHLGANGLVLLGAVRNCNIIGNEFYEISGNAINLGEVEGDNVYAPADSKYFVTDNEISNNYIHKTGDDYHSSSAIVLGYPKNTVVRNNEITDVPYDGIHAGWGWGTPHSGGIENLVIENNYIHNAMNSRVFDGAPIYVLGNTSGTKDNLNIIRGNYIKDSKNPVAGIYPDDGSTYWEISQNVIDTKRYQLMHFDNDRQMEYASWLNIWTPRISEIYLYDNYSTTTHYKNAGTGGHFEQAKIFANANWDDAAQKIIDNAGIEEQYRKRFDFGIQSLSIPHYIVMYAGTEQNIYYDALTSGEKVYDLSDCEITAKSSNESAATISDDKVSAVSAGKAVITYTVTQKDSDGNVLYYDEFSFQVMVK